MPKVRGGGPEEQPHVQGAAAGHRRAERSYSTFKAGEENSSNLRSSGCALLEQPLRDTPCLR